MCCQARLSMSILQAMHQVEKTNKEIYFFNPSADWPGISSASNCSSVKLQIKSCHTITTDIQSNSFYPLKFSNILTISSAFNTRLH